MSELEFILRLFDLGVAGLMAFVVIKIINWQKDVSQNAQNAEAAEAKERQSLVDLLREQWVSVSTTLKTVAENMHTVSENLTGQKMILGTIPQKTAETVSTVLLADDSKMLKQFESIRSEVQTLGTTIKTQFEALEKKVDALPNKDGIASDLKEIQGGLDQVLSRIEELAQNGRKAQEENHDRPVPQPDRPTVAPVEVSSGERQTVPGTAG